MKYRRSPRQRVVTRTHANIEKVRDALQEITAQAEEIWQEARFKVLAAQWKRETKFLSNVNKKCTHIAYQKIIGMGRAAVPLIINDLEQNGPNDWFWALHVITDANPITEEIAGNMQAMTEAWITWWRNPNSLPGFRPKMRHVFQHYVGSDIA
jgi:chemotaxis regulatin CheY-phosphate phosphatase CheZ